jgi:putative PIN family toxin of toxin-antitoxin system
VIRAVIDTNVLVSGLLSPAGNEALILLAIHQGLVHPCFSEEILEEYAAVLARPKFAFPSDEIAAVLVMFRSQGELFLPEASAATSPDPGDTKFLHGRPGDVLVKPPGRQCRHDAVQGAPRRALGG